MQTKANWLYELLPLLPAEWDVVVQDSDSFIIGNPPADSTVRYLRFTVSDETNAWFIVWALKELSGSQFNLQDFEGGYCLSIPGYRYDNRFDTITMACAVGILERERLRKEQLPRKEECNDCG